ncbi:hypothetical protein AURDEDRAFT_173674 [Auricularia subglabra TFB-10046 SS5]|nr:hypothetical protein AURDEDRAFT_173674 [Auricularia subglabra TFB-10046 SS5]
MGPRIGALMEHAGGLSHPKQKKFLEAPFTSLALHWEAVSAPLMGRSRIGETYPQSPGKPEGEAATLRTRLFVNFITGRLDLARLTKVMLQAWQLIPSGP